MLLFESFEPNFLLHKFVAKYEEDLKYAFTSCSWLWKHKISASKICSCLETYQHAVALCYDVMYA